MKLILALLAREQETYSKWVGVCSLLVSTLLVAEPPSFHAASPPEVSSHVFGFTQLVFGFSKLETLSGPCAAHTSKLSNIGSMQWPKWPGREQWPLWPGFNVHTHLSCTSGKVFKFEAHR